MLNVENSIVKPDIEQDVLMVSVLERFGRNGNKSLAFCSGWNLKKGAMASSAAPVDCIALKTFDPILLVAMVGVFGGNHMLYSPYRKR